MISNCLSDDRTPEAPCKLAPAGFCKGRQRYTCRKDRGGCGKSYMDDANPVGRPVIDDGLTNAERVSKCLGNMGTSGTGKAWYVVRDRSFSESAIVAVSLGTRRSVRADYPTCSIALLSTYPAPMRRWIVEKFNIPMY
mgnify:CR=1 FL=1